MKTLGLLRHAKSDWDDMSLRDFDRGHFVVLSPAFPSRLLAAFPPGTPVIRCTLDEALQRLATGVLGVQDDNRADQGAEQGMD